MTYRKLVLDWLMKWIDHVAWILTGSVVLTLLLMRCSSSQSGAKSLLSTVIPAASTSEAAEADLRFPEDPCDAEIVTDLRILQGKLHVTYRIPFAETPNAEVEGLRMLFKRYGQYAENLWLETSREANGDAPLHPEFEVMLDYEGKTYRLTRGLGEILETRKMFARYVHEKAMAQRKGPTRLGWLSGLAGPALTDLVPSAYDLRAVPQLLNSINVEYTSIDIQRGSIPVSEVDVLLITQPGRELSEDEQRALDTFLVKGGRSIIVVASTTLPLLDGTYINTEAGLTSWLARYGVKLENRSIRNAIRVYCGRTEAQPEQASEQCNPMIPLADRPAEVPATLDTTLNEGLALPFPYGSPVSIVQERQPDVRFRVLASVESAARPEPPTPVMVYGEGRFHSAFGPEEGEGRLLVIASSQFLHNAAKRDRAGDVDVARAHSYAMTYLPTAAYFITESARALSGRFGSDCEQSFSPAGESIH